MQYLLATTSNSIIVILPLGNSPELPLLFTVSHQSCLGWFLFFTRAVTAGNSLSPELPVTAAYRPLQSRRHRCLTFPYQNCYHWLHSLTRAVTTGYIPLPDLLPLVTAPYQSCHHWLQSLTKAVAIGFWPFSKGFTAVAAVPYQSCYRSLLELLLLVKVPHRSC